MFVQFFLIMSSRNCYYENNDRMNQARIDVHANLNIALLFHLWIVLKMWFPAIGEKVFCPDPAIGRSIGFRQFTVRLIATPGFTDRQVLVIELYFTGYFFFWSTVKLVCVQGQVRLCLQDIRPYIYMKQNFSCLYLLYMTKKLELGLIQLGSNLVYQLNIKWIIKKLLDDVTCLFLLDVAMNRHKFNQNDE